jgi:Asp-tRNA(Asn)/Glu-tRNA(Gln) amidotransferase A subunit family amidase
VAEDLCFRSASDIAAAIRRRELSPLDVFEAVARRIEAINPVLNAYCTLDLDRARAAARAAQEALAAKADVGPLHGVPVAVKDDLAVAGLRCTAGSQLLAEHVPEEDDLTVARLKQAGAVILGKTNLCEFGHKGVTDNLLFGTTCNPWDPTRTAGGSSGGSAAAVAAGLASFAVGTDIGGSIRVPAGCCGIVGLKPSLGRIPRVPVGNFFNPAWVPGPMTRTVADAALALGVLAGPDDRDPYSLPPLRPEELEPTPDVAGLRIAWSPHPTGGPVEPVVLEAARGALARLEALGAGVETLDRVLPVPQRALNVLLSGDVLSVFAIVGIASRWRFALLRLLGLFSPRYRLTPTFLPFARRAFRTSLRDYMRAQAEVTDFVEQSAGLFFRGSDVLATPTLALPPFPHPPGGLGPERVAGQPVNPHLGWLCTWPFNLTAQPALSVPCGWTADGLPVGLQLVARRGEEGLLLRLAAALEKANPWSGRRPPESYTRP